MTIRLRRYMSILASVILCAVFLPVSSSAQEKATGNSSKAAQEEDIQAAAFLFLFDGGNASEADHLIFCLSLDSDDGSIEHDPPDALVKRMAGVHRVIRKASECKITTKKRNSLFGVYDKKTGKHASMISAGPITWLDDKHVRVRGTRLCGGLCMWSATLEAHLEGGKWKVSVAPDEAIYMS